MDGRIDDCDNCPFTANHMVAGTCTCTNTGNCPPCSRDENCGVGGVCSLNQEDFDGDGVGDVCDNCPRYYNPRVCRGGPNDGSPCAFSHVIETCPGGQCGQTNLNGNGFGDACEMRMGQEFLPPDAVEYATYDMLMTTAAIQGTCVGGPG